MSNKEFIINRLIACHVTDNESPFVSSKKKKWSFFILQQIYFIATKYLNHS